VISLKSLALFCRQFGNIMLKIIVYTNEDPVDASEAAQGNASSCLDSYVLACVKNVTNLPRQLGYILTPLTMRQILFVPCTNILGFP
jgi:hypothetical protein